VPFLTPSWLSSLYSIMPRTDPLVYRTGRPSGTARRASETVLLESTIPDGPAEGTTINIDHLVDDYYDVKGWNK
jgi:hypothetical protein